MCSFFRSFGQTFGVAISSVIFQNKLTAILLASSNSVLVSNARHLARNAGVLVEVIKSLQDQAIKQELVTAYVDSLRVIWEVMCALSSVMLILSVTFTKDISLDRELETDQGFIHDQKVSNE